MKIALLGSTGGCGRAFLNAALSANHTVVVLARTPSKVTPPSHARLQIRSGDATSPQDVMDLCAGSDVVVSCIGGSGIMKTVATNVVDACKTHAITRCYFVTSLGMGGSSPTVRFLLGLFIGFDRVNDYDAADKIILDNGFTVVRPTGLTEQGQPLEKYRATADTGMAMGSIHKADVGRFLCDEITNNQWVAKPVQLYKWV